MLSRPDRVTDRRDFTLAVRRGRRAGSPTLVVHLWVPEPQGAEAALLPPRAGFVVGKAVGNAVTRNTVKRRLRHLVRERLPLLPAGSLLVVRALPAAAAAPSTLLGTELHRCLRRVLRDRADRGGPG